MKSKKYRALHIASAVLSMILMINQLALTGSAAEKETASPEGNFTNLIVYLRFNGEEEFIDDVCGGKATVREVTENSYAKAEYSVHDYYALASDGKVKMQSLYMLASDGSSITLEHTRGYYCTADDLNPEGYQAGEYSLRMYELKTDWSQAINNAFSNGAMITDAEGKVRYSIKDLDKNGDGYIDSLTLIYPYFDKYSVSWSDCLWNYQDYYTGVSLSDGDAAVESRAYLQMTANYNYLYSDAKGLPFVSLKTMIHETGHIFGLKDLYRSETDSRVYYMSAMAKAISPVPQCLSAKEREALGWLGSDNIKSIYAPGTYTVSLTSDSVEDKVICFKMNLADREKTVYFEYRKFNGNENKYDTQTKDIYNANGDRVKGINLKSGLVCFLADKNTKFPNNLNTVGSKWNYEVLGGMYATKSDAALGEGESLYITANICVDVLSVEDDRLTFKVSGEGIDTEGSLEMGDVNGDGKITAVDAQLMRSYISGNLAEGETFFAEVGDMDTDGKIAGKDQLILEKLLSGVDTEKTE